MSVVYAGPMDIRQYEPVVYGAPLTPTVNPWKTVNPPVWIPYPVPSLPIIPAPPDETPAAGTLLERCKARLELIEAEAEVLRAMIAAAEKTEKKESLKKKLVEQYVEDKVKVNIEEPKPINPQKQESWGPISDRIVRYGIPL